MYIYVHYVCMCLLMLYNWTPTISQNSQEYTYLPVSKLFSPFIFQSITRRLRSYAKGGTQVIFTVQHLSAAIVIQKKWQLHKSRGQCSSGRDPSEQCDLRVAPHIELEMLRTDQISLSPTWHCRQEKQNLPLDIDAKESKNDFGDRDEGDQSNETVRASIY